MKTARDRLAGAARRLDTPYARTVLFWALGVLVLGSALRKLDWPGAAAQAATVPAAALALTVAGLGASYLLRALRMRAELSRGRPAPLDRYLTLMLVHNAAVNVVPLRGGDAAYPVLARRWLGIPAADAMASLVWMRAQDAMVLALFGVAIWPGLPLPLRGAGGAAVVAAMVLAPRLLRYAAARAGREERHGPASRTLRTAAEALARAPEHGLAGWLFCLSSWACKLAAVAFGLAATAHLPPATAAVAALGGELAGALPLQGPAGFGTYEAGVWAGAALRGLRAPEIAVAAAAVHVLMLMTALVAGALARLRAGALPPLVAPGAAP